MISRRMNGENSLGHLSGLHLQCQHKSTYSILQIPLVDGRNGERIHNKCKRSEGLAFKADGELRKPFPIFAFP